MKKFIVLISTVFLFNTSIAFAETDSNYFSISGLFMNLDNAEFHNDIQGNIEFDSGHGFSGAIGKKLGPIRIEGEYGYKSIFISQLNGKDRTHADYNDIDLGIKNLMANIYYDLDINKNKITPYIGAGGGWAWLKEEDHDFFNDSAFAYQVMAGVNYNITETISLIAGYRFFGTAKIEMEHSFPSSTLRDSNRERVLDENGNRQYQYLGTSIIKSGIRGDNDRERDGGDPPIVLQVRDTSSITSHNFELGLRFAF